MNLGARVMFETDIENEEDFTSLNVNADLFGEYIVNTNISPLVLRQEPTTESAEIIQMPKGSTFSCYGFTDETNIWYLGEYIHKGKVYAGFAHKKYLERRI